MNRMVDANDTAWGRWVVLFGLGGFVGNFILSLCDHAQNGFFLLTEWIPVVSSAYAVSFFALAVLTRLAHTIHQPEYRFSLSIPALWRLRGQVRGSL